MTAIRVCVLIAAAFGLAGVAGSDTMGPISQYLMDSRTEIAIARSAAPASISDHATIMVLSSHGYKTAVQGTNGFTCIVERPWVRPFDSPIFWDRKFQAPTCYNAAASRSVLLYTYKRTALALSGASAKQIQQSILAAIAAKTLPIPEPDAMAYMMSKSQRVGDDPIQWYPHLMFFMPTADRAKSGASWGADLDSSPVVYDAQHKMPEPWAQFFIPITHWSDGTPAGVYSGRM